MKSVLIICDAFPPSFAPRMGYLCKYLGKLGWSAVVVSEYLEEKHFSFLSGYCDATFINYYPCKNRFWKKILWAGTMVLDILFGYKDRRMKKVALEVARGHRFDAVLCSTYRTFPLKAASDVAHELNIPLVADLRDIIEQYSGTEYISNGRLFSLPLIREFVTPRVRAKLLDDRNEILKKSDHVTTVSPWHVKTLQHYNPNVSLIYNGYDPEIFYPSHTSNGKFTIVYTGRIISLSMRNPELLFKGIRNSGLKPCDLTVEWFVDSNSEAVLRAAAEEYGVADYMDYKGYVQASDVPKVLNSAGIILILTESKGKNSSKGIMTTKFFEAMAVDKPVLCVPSDEGYLEEKINLTKTGIAAKTPDDVASFILRYHRQWMENGSTSICPDRGEVEKFSRKEQARQFADILNSVSAGR